MQKKSYNTTRGVKCKIATNEKRAKPKRKIGADTLEQINICLTCTKPAKECKGDCFTKKYKKDEN
jgi:hypothetical protein